MRHLTKETRLGYLPFHTHRNASRIIKATSVRKDHIITIESLLLVRRSRYVKISRKSTDGAALILLATEAMLDRLRGLPAAAVETGGPVAISFAAIVRLRSAPFETTRFGSD